MEDRAVREGELAEAVLLAVLELADVLAAVRLGEGALPVLHAVLELADVLLAVRGGPGALPVRLAALDIADVVVAVMPTSVPLIIRREWPLRESRMATAMAAAGITNLDFNYQRTITYNNVV